MNPAIDSRAAHGRCIGPRKHAGKPAKTADRRWFVPGRHGGMIGVAGPGMPPAALAVAIADFRHAYP
ncbi:hypothetical protein I6G79_01465 [Burkholderia plantarii]|nr:hypothetical protein [Burkholderia plantarii]